MRFARSQKGMSLLGWLVVLGVVAFFASAAFKIIPHYMDYYSLEKVITSVETDKAAEVRSVPEFYSYVGKGCRSTASATWTWRRPWRCNWKTTNSGRT